MKSATLAVLVLGTLGVFQVGDAVDYCQNKYSCNGVVNIGCNNSGAFAEACPADAQMVNLTDDLIAAILDSHNTKRHTLATHGYFVAHKRDLTWNVEMAMLASLNAKRCVFSYDSCHKTTEYKHSVQNIAKTWGTGTTPAPDDKSIILSEIDNWWSGNNSSVSREVMAAKSNVAVGCGAIKFTDAQFNNNPSLTLVCNYARSNNPFWQIITVM